MKRRLYILGAGAFGREVADMLGDFPQCGTQWEIAGFLHHGPDRLGEFPCRYRVVGDWLDFAFPADALAVAGVADMEWKRRIFAHLHGRVEFLDAIHPDARIYSASRLGAGCVIGAYSVLSTNVVLGDGVTVASGTLIGHDVRIGAYCTLMSHVDVGGGAELGSMVFMGPKSTLAPRKKIGDGCRIVAGAVVMRHLGAGKIVYGNPACELEE